VHYRKHAILTQGDAANAERTHWHMGEFLLDINHINGVDVHSSSKIGDIVENQEEMLPIMILDEEQNGPESRYEQSTHLL